MTQQLRSEWVLDVQSWIASAQQAGTVTQREADKMQRTLNSVQAAVKAIGQRVGDVQQLGQAHKEAAEGAERTAEATSGITRELLVLSHELSTGQYKRFGGSLLVLAEYSTSAKAALSALVGPLGVVAVGLGIVGAVAMHGANEQHEFANMLIMTGNAAGLTAKRLEDVAAAAAKSSKATIGAGVESALAVAGTGKFGPDTFQAATEAALLFQRATGKTADEVVAELAKMRDGVAAWASEHNRSMHFMSAAQYEAIRRMEEAGHAEEAQRAVLDALNSKLSESTKNLGYFAQAWQDVKDGVSATARAIENWGKSATIDTEVERVAKRLAVARADLDRAQQPGGGLIDRWLGSAAADKVRELEQILAKLRESKAVADQVASAQAEVAARQDKGVEARKWIDDRLEKSKSQLNLTKELEQAQRRFNEAEAAGVGVSQQERAAILADIRSKYTPPEDKKLQTEFDNLIKSLADEKVKLDAEAQSWTQYQRALDNARAAVVRFRVQQGDLKGLGAQQKATAIGAAEAADAAERSKRDAESLAWAKKKTEALINEATARALSSREEAVARVLHEDGAKALKKESVEYRALADAARAHYDAMIATPAIAKWVQSMDEEVRKIREETAALGMGTLARQQAEAAIRLHAAASAEAAKYPERETEIWLRYMEAVERVKAALADKDAASRTFGVGVNTALQQYVRDATDHAKFAENMILGTLKRAEDAFIEFAKTGKLNLGSLFSFMAEEYLRQTFRMQVAQFIGPTASPSGTFSLAGLWNGVTSWASGFFSHATGADYIPYDGYPALLHEGERVLTKQEARAGAGGGMTIDARTTIQQVGSNVSRADMMAVVNQSSRATEARMRRLLSQKGITV